MPPWVFDVVVIAVILLSAVMSVGRGLIRETISVIAFVVGLVVAWFAMSLGEAPLKKIISPDQPSVVPALILFLVGFIAAYVIAAFLGSRLSRLINESPEIGAFDRFTGAGLGAIKGLLACIGFIVLMHLLVCRGGEPPEIAKSFAYPYLDAAANLVGGGLRSVIELFTGPITSACR